MPQVLYYVLLENALISIKGKKYSISASSFSPSSLTLFPLQFAF